MHHDKQASSCEKKDKDCQGPGIKVKMQQLAPGFVQQMQVSRISFIQYQCIGASCYAVSLMLLFLIYLS